MPDHECHQKTTIALMGQTLTNFGEKIDKADGKLDKIVEALPAVTTDIALVKQSVKRQWWIIAIIVGPIIGGAVWVLRS